MCLFCVCAPLWVWNVSIFIVKHCFLRFLQKEKVKGVFTKQHRNTKKSFEQLSIYFTKTALTQSDRVPFSQDMTFFLFEKHLGTTYDLYSKFLQTNILFGLCTIKQSRLRPYITFLVTHVTSFRLKSQAFFFSVDFCGIFNSSGENISLGCFYMNELDFFNKS